jgi:hypothetical protein
MARITGDPSLWSEVFPEELIPQILEMALSVWGSMPKPHRRTREVPITLRFLTALKEDKNMRQEVPVRISRECVEDDMRTGRELGRIDLCFIPAYRCREEVYFAFECKRLNVVYKRGRNTLAPAYVRQGMMRFIKSQYASRLYKGGMIGYVMDGDQTSAIIAVDRNVKRHRAALRMKLPGDLGTSSVLPSHPSAKETVHNLGARKFHIHHLFLPL